MSPLTRPNILVIMGSVRAGRRCPQIARWVSGIIEQSEAVDCEIIDLGQWRLPADDEPKIPAKGDYEQSHTRAWSAKVAACDGVVIVTPQYNWGYPAPLKNALDHLYKEWSGKPSMIVTYGGHGGGKCAAQLRQVASGLKMRLVETMPAITLSHAAIEQELPLTEEELDAYSSLIRKAAAEMGTMLASAG